MGKALVILGIAIALLGLAIWFGGRWFGWLGRLPGDLRVEGERGAFILPITSCIVVSIALSLLLALVRRLLS